MKYIFISTILISCAYLIKAQDNSLSDHLIFEKQISLQENIYGPNECIHSKSSDSNELAFTFYNTRDFNDTVHIYILNTDNDNISIEKYYIKNLRKSLINDYTNRLDDITFSKNHLAIVTSLNIYLVQRKNQQIINKLNNEDLNFDEAEFLGSDEILLFSNYNSHKLDRTEKTEFTVFTIPDLKLINQKFPKFDYIQYSHILPSHWVSSLNNKILFSQTIDYRIELFDQQLNIKNAINLPDDFIWISLNNKQKKRIKKTNPGIEAIQEVMKYENDIHRIAGVYWISDSTFIVNVNKGIGTNNVKYKLSFDVWKLRNGEWLLDKYNLVDKPLNEIKLENMEYSLFSGKFGRRYIFTENFIYLLFFNSPVLINPNSTEQYIKESNEYLYDNDPVFQILKFKHTLNE